MPDFMNAVRSAKYDLSSLTGIVSSAAPHSSSMITELLYRIGARGLEFSFGYGLTEASPAVTLHPNAGSVLQKEGNSIGVPLLTSEIRVVDKEGNDVPKGEVGELIVRGPQVFKGYIKDEEATKQTLKNGWLYTGDLVKEDEDGNFWFIGRSKDMIKSGGENVFSEEVEQSIMRANPEVEEVAVYGKPDERWGEAVAVACVLKPDATLTEEELISRTKKVLSHYKVPKYVYFVKEFPRTGSGKVAKHMLPELEKQRG
jgi:fatty-acyl-CoA synthase